MAFGEMLDNQFPATNIKGNHDAIAAAGHEPEYLIAANAVQRRALQEFDQLTQKTFG